MTDANTPGPGHNEAPDYAQETTNQMARDYAELFNTYDSLAVDARLLPNTINDDYDALQSGAIIKRFRDLDSRVENIRVVEGEPHLRRKNAIDALFFGLRDKIGRRNKADRKSKAGATDVIQARINDYQDRKIAAERARLAAERAEAEHVAREADRRAREEAAAAEAARLAAERARKPETSAAKNAAADELAGKAAQAASLAQAAEERLDDAVFASTAKPSDIARVRGNDSAGGGVTLSVAQEPYATLVDRNLVDIKALLPFLTDAEIEKALRAWARTTGHRVKMDGTEIGFRNKGSVR